VYWIVVNASTNDSTNYVKWFQAALTGANVLSSSDGSSWSSLETNRSVSVKLYTSP